MSITSRAITKFPVNVTGANGDKVARAGGAYTIGPDYGSLALGDAGLANQPNLFARFWDEAQEEYSRISLATILALVGNAVNGAVAPYTGRLTLESGVPVSLVDKSGASASAIYFTPEGSDLIPLWNGSAWVLHEYAEMQLLLNNPAHAINQIYDVWAFLNNGSPYLGSGPAWTSAVSGISMRGAGAGTTEFEMWQGRRVNKNVATLRNGMEVFPNIPARQAFLLGSFLCRAAGQTEDSLIGRFVSNLYNATPRQMVRRETMDNWHYSTNTWRQANLANTTANRLYFLNTVGGRAASARVSAAAKNSTATLQNVKVGIGVNSNTADSATERTVCQTDNVRLLPVQAGYDGVLDLGFNALYWLEAGSGAEDQTWAGLSANPIPDYASSITAWVTV